MSVILALGAMYALMFALIALAGALAGYAERWRARHRAGPEREQADEPVSPEAEREITMLLALVELDRIAAHTRRRA
jgi:hypothetical protein